MITLFESKILLIQLQSKYILRAEKSSCKPKIYPAGRETSTRTQKLYCGPRNPHTNPQVILRTEKPPCEPQSYTAGRETSTRTPKLYCGPRNFDANPMTCCGQRNLHTNQEKRCGPINLHANPNNMLRAKEHSSKLFCMHMILFLQRP